MGCYVYFCNKHGFHLASTQIIDGGVSMYKQISVHLYRKHVKWNYNFDREYENDGSEVILKLAGIRLYHQLRSLYTTNISSRANVTTTFHPSGINRQTTHFRKTSRICIAEISLCP